MKPRLPVLGLEAPIFKKEVEKPRPYKKPQPSCPSCLVTYVFTTDIDGLSVAEYEA